MKKKYFLVWADNGPEINSLIEAFDKRGYDLAYWVGLRENTSRYKNIPFHDHYAAWAGQPAPGLENLLVPPSQELVLSRYETESVVMTMMNKRFDRLIVDDRKHLYYQMLGYWNAVLERFQPELIVFPTVPHSVYNYVLYDLAKGRGIKTLMFEDTWVLDHLLMYENWQSGSRWLKEELLKNKGQNFKLTDLTVDLQQYYLKQTNPKTDSTPVYMTHWKNKYSRFNKFLTLLKRAKSSLFNGSIFKRLPLFIAKQFKSNLKKEYEPLQTAPNFETKFIYVPLNFQPERTTSPQGGIFVDQILMVETLASSLPRDWQIYVKEHPSQWWLRSGTNYSSARYRGYYQRLAAINKVSLLPIQTNSFELIGKSKAVATVTGTAGWEALLRLKPVLIFGSPWYRDFPSLFRVVDIVSCRDALRQIEAGFTVKSSELLYYLKCLSTVAIRGYVEGFIDRISKLSKQKSMNNILSHIFNHD